MAIKTRKPDNDKKYIAIAAYGDKAFEVMEANKNKFLCSDLWYEILSRECGKYNPVEILKFDTEEQMLQATMDPGDVIPKYYQVDRIIDSAYYKPVIPPGLFLSKGDSVFKGVEPYVLDSNEWKTHGSFKPHPFSIDDLSSSGKIYFNARTFMATDKDGNFRVGVCFDFNDDRPPFLAGESWSIEYGAFQKPNYLRVKGFDEIDYTLDITDILRLKNGIMRINEGCKEIFVDENESQMLFHSLYELSTGSNVPFTLLRSTGPEVYDYSNVCNDWSRFLPLDIDKDLGIIGFRYIDYKDCTNLFVEYKDGTAKWPSDLNLKEYEALTKAALKLGSQHNIKNDMYLRSAEKLKNFSTVIVPFGKSNVNKAKTAHKKSGVDLPF